MARSCTACVLAFNGVVASVPWSVLSLSAGIPLGNQMPSQDKILSYFHKGAWGISKVFFYCGRKIGKQKLRSLFFQKKKKVYIFKKWSDLSLVYILQEHSVLLQDTGVVFLSWLEAKLRCGGGLRAVLKLTHKCKWIITQLMLKKKQT